MEKTMRIQGDSILHTFDYIKRKKGIKGLEELITESKINPKDVYPERWYPVEQHLRLLELVDKKFHYNDYPVVSRIGFNRAKHIGFLNSPFQKVEPEAIFKQVKDRWSRFSDFGRIELRNIGEHQADIYICNGPSHPLYCQRMQGFFMGILLTVCKVKNADVEHIKCKSSGNKYCKFEARWE
jgi:hypothetical protein